MSPRFSIVTRRHGHRPKLWAQHLASLEAQTFRDFEHVTFAGGDSLGQANRSLHLHRGEVRGEYVLVLDDDDRLSDPEALRAIEEASFVSKPGVVFLRMRIDGKPYPTSEAWEKAPQRRHIGASCFAVRRDLWLAHIRHWAQPRAGDFFFIRAVMRMKPSVVWLDRVCSETMRVSQGRGESTEGKGDPSARNGDAPSESVHLVTFVPYDAGGDLGRAYNDCMERLQPDEWAVFLDHDAMFLTRDWHSLICGVIAVNPTAGLLTARTNRIGQRAQLDETVTGHDVGAHRKHAHLLAGRHKAETSDVTGIRPGISGVVIATPRRAWEKVKATNGRGFESGFLGVDNAYHAAVAKAGFAVRVMKGLYVYHWYRGDGDRSHLTNGRQVVAA